jgi:glycosyltransferase involved in cell wall biosynthesis
MAERVLGAGEASGVVTRAPVTVATTYYRPVLGGAEVAAERLARYLARRGHAVRVVTKQTSRDLPALETIDGVTVERLPPVAERSGRGKWAVAPAMLRAFLRDRHRSRVVCCIDYRGIGLAALAARSVTGVPVIFQAQTEGVLAADRVRSWLGARGVARDGTMASAITWPIRAMYRGADAIACISHDLEREALAAGVARERVHYLPNPVDCDRFAPALGDTRQAIRLSLGLADDTVVGVFVGRLSREKGAVELIRAWAQAKPNARLVVIGPPMTDHPWDVSAEARALADQSGLGSAITFLGGQPAPKVAEWLSIADFAIQPSHFEAMGLAAAEEMASGLPVIASDTGGFRDFVKPEETGLLVPVKDVPALAGAIERMVTDSALRVRMGVSARRRAESFDERVVLERFAELIDRLSA